MSRRIVFRGRVCSSLLWLVAVTWTVLLGIGIIPVQSASLWVGIYTLASAATFSAYLWDKHRSMDGGPRIRERSLHALELIGGWPGALLAQRLLRHKNRKVSYQLVFWLVVALHAGFWAWRHWGLADRALEGRAVSARSLAVSRRMTAAA